MYPPINSISDFPRTISFLYYYLDYFSGYEYPLFSFMCRSSFYYETDCKQNQSFLLIWKNKEFNGKRWIIYRFLRSLTQFRREKDLVLCHVLCEFRVIPVKPFGIIPVHPFYTFHKSCKTVYVQERKPWLFLMLHSFQNKYSAQQKLLSDPKYQ